MYKNAAAALLCYSFVCLSCRKGGDEAPPPPEPPVSSTPKATLSIYTNNYNYKDWRYDVSGVERNRPLAFSFYVDNCGSDLTTTIKVPAGSAYNVTIFNPDPLSTRGRVTKYVSVDTVGSYMLLFD